MERHIEENYEEIVATGARSFADIADQAARDNSPELEAWARDRAANGGDQPKTEPSAPAYADMLLADLKELVKPRGIEPEAKWLKANYVDALEAKDAEEAQAKKTASDAADAEGLYVGIEDDNLRVALSTRNLDDTGDRPDLIARLRADDETKAAPGA
ncbi:MAG: hypothetical protein ABJB03_00505 [Rhodoglobus sp.]